MGEMADYYIQQEIDNMCFDDEGHVEYHELLQIEKSLTWTTKDGREMNISEMTTLHLENTIKFLERKEQNDITNAWVAVLSIELLKRG